MEKKPEGNFGKIYDSPPETIQKALDADAARPDTVHRPAPGPRTGRSGRVELIAKADPRVWNVAKVMLAEQDVYPDYQPDGSVILRNGSR